MLKESKESMTMITYQMEGINKEIEIINKEIELINKELNRNSGFKVKRTKMKNSLAGPNSKFYWQKKQIIELEYR